jgi:putative hydrolase of the HAD superfamily
MIEFMNKISTLFLDIGGVLLTNGWDSATRQKAAKAFHVNAEEMNERHHLTYDTYEDGKLSLDDYLDRVIFFEPRSFSKQDFKTYMYDQSRPFPEMIRMFQNLKERYHLKIVTVSNEGRELTAYRIQNFGLASFVDAFVSSCFVHFRKPDSDIFQIALDIAQVPPQDVAYVDDRGLFIEVARSLGINGIHHNGYESTRQELGQLGLWLG